MHILAVDTSSPHPSAVIARCADRESAVPTGIVEVLAEVAAGHDLGYSEHLFGAIESLLAESGITLADVDVYGAVRGPGSFTGIRVGMAAIDGLAFTRRKPAFGVSALAAIAWQHPSRTPSGRGGASRLIVPLIDARHGRFYGAVYRPKAGHLVEVEPPDVRETRTWLELAAHAEVTYAGSGTEPLAGEIAQIPGADHFLGNSALARTAAEMIAAGVGDPLAPLYVLRTSAEENHRRTARAEQPPPAQVKR